MQQPVENAHEVTAAEPQHEKRGGQTTQLSPVASESKPLTVTPKIGVDWPTGDYPKPAVLDEDSPVFWVDEAPQAENYFTVAQRLAKCGDLYRNPQYGGGLLLASQCPAIPPTTITKGSQLAPIIADRLVVAVVKKGKLAGSQIPSKQLDTMLKTEVFLQSFSAVDSVVATPMYIEDYHLTQPGYNNGGPGDRIYYVGSPPQIKVSLDAIHCFLDAMDFACEADRTAAVAAALTRMLRNHWPGDKPVILVTASKSHAGKDTIICFAAGTTESVSISYQSTNWAFERSFVAAIKQHPSAAVLIVENARLNRRDEYIASAFLERFATDPAPFLCSTGTGEPERVRNDFVVAISTNFGKVSEDIMNRALPIHLTPIGDVASRRSPIGNPKWEFLPTHREEIEAELRGMVEGWKDAGRPLDEDVKHPFTAWAKTIGGILKVAGFEHFSGNYTSRKTADDPLRQALGLLGAARPDAWLRTDEFVQLVAELGLARRIIPVADRDSPASQRRGLGVVLSAHQDEVFQVATEDETITVQLKKARRRFGEGQPSTRYMFQTLQRQVLPADDEESTIE